MSEKALLVPMIDSRVSIYLFPIAILLNVSSMTILLIGAGVMGHAELAADVAIVQGATLAVFFSFSANARSIILAESSRVSWQLLLTSRGLLLVPVGGLALAISLQVSDVSPLLATGLVLRRCVEWLAEVYLARRERQNRYQSAFWFILLQVVLLCVALLPLLTGITSTETGLLLWALVPLLYIGHFLIRNLSLRSLAGNWWAHLLPHYGSTAITGISVFVFRLIVLLLAGKTYAGNLFTGFAIGGMMGSIFAQALGPTLIFHAKGGSTREIPGWLKVILLISTAFGIAIISAYAADWPIIHETDRLPIFWLATGASLIGGAVMVLAQRLRLRLIQHHVDGDVFGPDLLTNIFIVACVPYVFYLIGTEAMGWLFLLNATIALVFYSSAELSAAEETRYLEGIRSALAWAIPVGLLLPVFFQLKGDIFHDRVPVLDSGGDLWNLPIPISVLVCYGAIVLLGTYGRARESLTIVFVCFCLMTVAAVLSTQHDTTLQQSKMILLIQFLLPMLALILGQMYGDLSDVKRHVARAGLYVIGVVVPVQLLATFAQGVPYLSSYVYLFSIYQNLLYVPVIFACAFLVACFTLWWDSSHRVAILTLAIPMGAYAMLSLSKLTIGLLCAGVIAFLVYVRVHAHRSARTASVVLVLLVGCGMYAGILISEHGLRSGNYSVGEHETYLSMIAGMRESGRHPDESETFQATDVPDRVTTWRYYLQGILLDGESLMFGHEAPPARSRFPSAQNYFLDFVYSFGVVAVLPLLWLVAVTVGRVGRHRRSVLADPGLLALALAVLFLVLVDNFLTVGLRQPYPAMVTFFLWGLLLSCLSHVAGREAPGESYGQIAAREGRIVGSGVDDRSR